MHYRARIGRRNPDSGGSVIGGRPATGDGTYRNVSVAFNVAGAR